MKKRKYAIIRTYEYDNEKYVEFFSGFGMNRLTGELMPLFQNNVKDPTVFTFYTKKEAKKYLADIQEEIKNTYGKSQIKIIKVKRKDRRA